MFVYTQTNPFVLVDTETRQIVDSFEVLGLVYDCGGGSCSLLKHGSYPLVKKWWDSVVEQYTRNNLQDILADMKLLRIEACLLDDLNFVLMRSAIPEKYFERLQVVTV